MPRWRLYTASKALRPTIRSYKNKSNVILRSSATSPPLSPPPSAASRAVINGHRRRWREIALNTLLIASEWLRHPLDATYALDALINK